MFDVQEQEERDFTHTSEAEWDAEDARDRGSRRTDCQWICSDRDVWYRNPYYTGPDQPHPEYDDCPDPEGLPSEAACLAYDPPDAEPPF
jgi:hypothetical protein